MSVRSRIGLRQVRSLKPGETIWDKSLTGFGARRQHSDAVSYVLFYRTKEGRQRWFTIGKHGAPWMPETARDEAKRLLGEVAHRGDPAADICGARKSHARLTILMTTASFASPINSAVRFATASAAARSTASAECKYLDVVERPWCPTSAAITGSL